ncbi:Aminopeptidase S [Luteitalea pratensis]|uniref:Aminopeptidase S n=1 Tax=Luteitalea pratensis TaxID=1855912 RepID=A0A143PVV8_LUTPR|nr:M28 family peptidase [Luteitalea pratensis]AMY12328.1 Aminopeptidase S [Luteitalea pratensis]
MFRVIAWRTAAAAASVVAVMVLAPLALRPAAQAPAASGLDLASVSAARIVAHATLLADDLYEGRAPGSRGGDLAARYIATQFALLGLEPGAKDGTWYQPVPIVEATVDRDATTLEARGSGGTRAFTMGKDLSLLASVDAASVSLDAEVVFVGHGIVAPEFDWNDYAGADVKGKVVMAMVNDPPATPTEPALFGGKALTYYGRWTYKYEEALRQGAAGAILIHTDASATYPFGVVLSTTVGEQVFVPSAPGTPALQLKAWLTEDASTALAAIGGHDLAALRKRALTRGARAVPLGVTVSLRVQQKTVRKTSPNVIAKFPGQRTDEAIVFSSHYDHMGRRETSDGSDGIWNGARDNASGVAALLELARTYAAASVRPGRTVYFLAPTAEERGLLGSEYFAQHAPFPIDRIAANLNMDSMNVYGSSSTFVLLGADRTDAFGLVEEVARQQKRAPGVDEHPERGYFFRSDHFPLAKAGVPAFSLTLGDASGFRGPRAAKAREISEAYNATRYHQPSDEISPDWDWTGAVEDTQLLAELGWRIAALPRMPAYKPGDQFAQPRAKKGAN